MRTWTAFRPRLSLRGLLILVCIIAYAMKVVVDTRRVHNLRQEYARAVAEYEVGLRAPGDLCQASLELCIAELRLPLSDDCAAIKAHLARVEERHEFLEAMIPFDGATQSNVDDTRRYVEQARALQREYGCADAAAGK